MGKLKSGETVTLESGAVVRNVSVVDAEKSFFGSVLYWSC